MLFPSIVQNYLLWHYTRAFGEMFHVWLNFLWFVLHFFSIPQLARSWFAPFKRITEPKRSGWSFEDLAGYVIINLFSRIVGALFRTVIIIIGLIVLTLVIALGVLVYLAWIFLPILVLGSIVTGIGLLFT